MKKVYIDPTKIIKIEVYPRSESRLKYKKPWCSYEKRLRLDCWLLGYKDVPVLHPEGFYLGSTLWHSREGIDHEREEIVGDVLYNKACVQIQLGERIEESIYFDSQEALDLWLSDLLTKRPGLMVLIKGTSKP